MLEISLIAAFVGGVLSLLPACGPALLPGFFAYSIKERGSTGFIVFQFALGFTLLFLPFSLGLSRVANFLIGNHSSLYVFVGWLLIVFGLWSLTNLRFGTYITTNKYPQSPFWLGLIFGLTSSSCTAPVYGAIISLATAETFFQSLTLLVIFELGLFVPLWILALVLRARPLNIVALSKPLKQFSIGKIGIVITPASIISATIFIVLGIFYIKLNGGAPFLNFSDDSGLLDWFYKVNQKLLE